MFHSRGSCLDKEGRGPVKALSAVDIVVDYEAWLFILVKGFDGVTGFVVNVGSLAVDPPVAAWVVD